MRADDGQAGIELLALLPLVLVISLALGQVLAAGVCRELAGHAAGAGAQALLAGRRPVPAARVALPGWAAGRARVEVRGRRVTVVLRAPAVLPGLAGLLSARSVADAGPAA
ncbi:unannotated protein [freshwater metagenome]|uniref:Unannotated protein n=1 Tax=freshwater metagenome TaxID=449393 RepID=A0A6J7HUC9_9ZZZZ|nr:pilus assembly protein [Actinomycetota bacterium]